MPRCTDKWILISPAFFSEGLGAKEIKLLRCSLKAQSPWTY